MTFALGADLREVMPCPRCRGAHLVIELHVQKRELVTELGVLTHWFECPRTRQQVAAMAADYPKASEENIRALRPRIA